jgi:hypothetical protein
MCIDFNIFSVLLNNKKVDVIITMIDVKKEIIEAKNKYSIVYNCLTNITKN